MRLYFLRHGEAYPRSEWLSDDAERPLTDAGREEMRRAAVGLAALDPRPDLICTSPLVRAAETAGLVAQALGVPVYEAAELAPGCALDGLARLLDAHRGAGRLMLVGHNPDFGELIGHLIAGKRGASVELRKGAICRVDVPTPVEEAGQAHGKKLTGKGTLVWLLTARQLGLIGEARRTAAAGEAAAQPTADAENGDGDADGPAAPGEPAAPTGQQATSRPPTRTRRPRQST